MVAKSESRSPRIEILEPLVLMSASGMDAELCEVDEATAAELSIASAPGDEPIGEVGFGTAIAFDGVQIVSLGELEDDQLVLSGNRSEYRITDLRNGAILVSNGQSSDIFNDLASLVFNDQTVGVDAIDFDAVMVAPVRFVPGVGPVPLPPGPIPVEADGGIGDGAGPIPVDSTDTVNTPAEDLVFPEDPDDFLGIAGSSPGFSGPIPVEPDGGIGDGAGPIPLPFPIQLIEGPDGQIQEFPIVPIGPEGESGFVTGVAPGEDGSPPVAGIPPIPINDPNASIGITATGEPLFFSNDERPIALPSFGATGNGGAAATGVSTDDVTDLDTLAFADDLTTTSITADAGTVDSALFLDSEQTAGVEAQSGIAEGTPVASDSLVVTADQLPGFPIEQPPTITPTIQGTDAGEWIVGGADDSIAAGGGDDEIYVPGGATIIDGGDGIDTLVIYEGYRDQYTIALRSDGVSTLEGPGLNGQTVQVDLFQVERIQFNDGILDLSTITTVIANPSSGDPVLTGTDASEWIGGTAADDSISAGGGDDEIYAPLGTNEIDGGDGEDTLLVYEGNRADYTLSNIGDGRIYIEGPGLNGETVRSFLSNVERILFNDEVVLTSDITDLSDVIPFNGPLVNSDTAVAGASIAAGDQANTTGDDNSVESILDDGLVAASQAMELIQESGFEDTAVTQESLTALASQTVSGFGASSMLSDAVIEQAVASGFDAIEDADVDLDSLTIQELVQAGADALQAFGTAEADDSSTDQSAAAAEAGLSSLQASGFGLNSFSADDFVEVASVGFGDFQQQLSADESDDFNASLLGFGIDLDALLSGFDDPGANI